MAVKVSESVTGRLVPRVRKGSASAVAHGTEPCLLCLRSAVTLTRVAEVLHC